jgi:hypothetical protein
LAEYWADYNRDGSGAVHVSALILTVVAVFGEGR